MGGMMSKTPHWEPLGMAEAGIVQDIAVTVWPDSKFSCASIVIDALAYPRNRVRLHRESGKRLHLRHKKSEFKDIFKALIGHPINYQLYKSPDGRTIMNFVIVDERIKDMRQKADALAATER